MRFSTPIGYSLLINVIFSEDTTNYHQAQISKTVLDELEKKLKQNFDRLDWVKEGVKHSLKIHFFIPKEGSYRGAKKEMKIILIKLKKILINLSVMYEVKFKAYIYHDLDEFFN